ncbi:MAG: XRE family transcriptional regulator, partial [Campylobacterales bacterium]|nr:XRE family transcriptional regulator [Campylobacterales bacterium]
EFAEHIGMSYGTYARFEKTGQVSFVGFLEIVKGLNLTDQIVTFFQSEEEQLISW